MVISKSVAFLIFFLMDEDGALPSLFFGVGLIYTSSLVFQSYLVRIGVRTPKTSFLEDLQGP